VWNGWENIDSRNILHVLSEEKGKKETNKEMDVSVPGIL
jgi:hypothetical protein